MPVSGTFSELGPVELLQFPANGNKSGRLLVSSPVGSGEFGFDCGRLVYAECAGSYGDDAVVNFVMWEEGEFNFAFGDPPENRNVTSELHRLLMTALAKRDEATARETEITTGTRATPASRVRKVISDYVDSHSGVTYAALIDGDGSVVVDAVRGEPPMGAEAIGRALATLMSSRLRGMPRRVMVEGPTGSAVCARASTGDFVLALADESVAAGGSSFGVTKLVADLGDLGGG